ncbi:hypothetical protein GCM10027073_16100 [Streptomyces chlorus]
MVTRTRASPRRSRCSTGPGPKAEKSGQSTLVFFSVPSTVVYNSGQRPSRVNTRSPRPTPSDRRAFAKRAVRRASSAYVTVETESSRATQRRAALSAWSDAACRSTASWAMLSPPPGSPASSVRAWAQVKSELARS